EFVGIEPRAATDLVRKLDHAAHELNAHADEVQRLLDQADVSSSAPQQIREVAAWAARRKADLEWRIEVITAAEGQSGPGLRTMHFEFGNAKEARNAGRGEGKRVADLLAHLKSPAKSKRFRDELERLKKHAGDPAYTS